MLADLIVSSQAGNNEVVVNLIDRFKPLLKKYAYKLKYEDAYYDLVTDFIKLVKNINLNNISNRSDGGLVSYIHRSLHSYYLKRLNKNYRPISTILFAELSEKEQFYLEVSSSTTDSYSLFEIIELKQILSEHEYDILQWIYVDGYSAAEIAKCCNVSRQAVNQSKIRALKKLRIVLLPSERNNKNGGY